MNLALFLAYLLAIAILIATPGPNALLMVSHALHWGRRAAFFNALGGVTAALVLICLVLFGLTSLLPAWLMPYLAMAGAGYLLWLSFQALRPGRLGPSPPTGEPVVVGPRPRFYRDAFLTGISNPKDLLFFVLFLPQFLDKTLVPWVADLVLLGGWVVCDFGLMMAYGLASHRLSLVLSPERISWVKRGVGAILGLIGLGLLGAEVWGLFFPR